MFKADYLGIHENKFRQLKKEGKPGWSSEDEINEMLACLDKAFLEEKHAESGKLLELGCGSGGLTLRLSQRGFEVYGIDISPTAITWAKEKATEQAIKADFREGNVLDLPYPDDYFDIVVDGHCLHCIIGDDRKSFFSNAYRVLKNEGLFIVMTMCGDPGEEEVKKYIDPATRCMVIDGIAGRYFGKPEDILDEIKSAGFIIKSWEINHDAENKQDGLRAAARKSHVL